MPQSAGDDVSSAPVRANGESPARRYARLWREGGRPDLAGFLMGEAELVLEQVLSILHVDQQERWRSGERKAAEAYLPFVEALGLDPEYGLDLIFHEFLIREEAGDSPQLDEFVARFPEHAEDFRLQVALHRAIERPTPLDAPVPPRPARAPGNALPIVLGYEVLREIGRGGMGVVYEAWQTGLKRRVALKMIRAGDDPRVDQQDRFRFEAEAVARLHHPNIVEVYEIGDRDGQPFFSLEYVDGGSLDKALGGMPQPPRRAADWIATLARAMDYAHRQGIVHRDLKPANVLLTSEGIPKVVDFGLAKGLDDNDDHDQTRTGMILGSPCYMAPEQSTGRQNQVGPATDVYALGALLYEMLTGSPPFRAETPLDTLELVRTADPIPPSRLRPKIPRDLETICLKCLEKAPQARYSTAGELAEEVGRYLDDRPIKARPVGVGPRLWRWCRRRKALATAVGVAVFAMLTTVALSLGFAVTQYRTNARLSEALAEIGSRRHQLDGMAANLAYEQGQSLCEQGDVGLGMLWLARGLEGAANAGDTNLQQALRANLAGWRRRLPVLRARFEHSDQIYAIALSPDGQTALTGGDDGSARLWDVATGTPIGVPMQHSARVGAVAFSPDGRFIATGSYDWSAKIWDTGGRPIGRPLLHQHLVQAVAFAPDSRSVLTGSWDRMARLWDVATGAMIGKPMVQSSWVTAVAYSPDGRTLLVACNDGSARFWNASTFEPVGYPFRHPGWITSVAFAPDGRSALTGGLDGTAQLWDVATGQPIGEPLRHQHCVSSVAFGPDGRTVLTGSYDGTARLWDTDSHEATGIQLRHQHRISAVAFAPGGRGVLIGSFDGSARFWEIPEPEYLALRHQGFIRSAVFSPDGRTILTGSVDRTARLWDAKTGRPIGSPLRHEGTVESVAFAPDGRTILTGGADRVARLWDAGSCTPIGSPMKHEGLVTAVAFRPDSRVVATASEDKTAGLWDATTGHRIGPPLRHDEQVNAVAFDPAGRILATASADKTARLWDATTGQPIGIPLRHDGPVFLATISPNGRTLATASEDRSGRLWDIATGTLVGKPLRHEGPVSVVRFSRGGDAVLTGGWDWMARLWHSKSGEPIGKPLRHNGTLRALAISPDGRTLATGSYDRTAQLWDKVTGRPIGPALRHERQVWFVAFSPDGKTILTGGQENQARVWEAPEPLEDSVERIGLMIEAATGSEMGEDGTIRALDDETWRARRGRWESSAASGPGETPANHKVAGRAR